MKGRAPLPKNIRVLRGSRPARTAVTDPDKEVELPVKIPLPPDGLTPEETDVFVTTARTLARMRVMNEAAVAALVIYCRNYVEMEMANEKIRASGHIVKAPTGYPIVNPWVSFRRKAEDRCLEIMAEFGLTPAAMTRVSRQG